MHSPPSSKQSINAAFPVLVTGLVFCRHIQSFMVTRDKRQQASSRCQIQVCLFSFVITNCYHLTQLAATMLTMSIPLNSGIINKTITRTTIRVSSSLPFDQIFKIVCRKMGLDILKAELGYKFPGD